MFVCNAVGEGSHWVAMLSGTPGSGVGRIDEESMVKLFVSVQMLPSWGEAEKSARNFLEETLRNAGWDQVKMSDDSGTQCQCPNTSLWHLVLR